MNIYMIVEGAETETKVYPEWLCLLAPNMSRIDDAWSVKENSYYLFSGGGIPSIFQHISNAVADINQINLESESGKAYDYLMVCMETWFLGNRVIYKENPQSQRLSKFIHYYNVKQDDPEDMGNINESEYATKAQFHHQYLKDMFRERNIRYSKNNPSEVCKQNYLNRLIERYEETGHIESFGKWYKFVKKLNEN